MRTGVIGAGIAGLASAYLLEEAGLDDACLDDEHEVVLFEKNDRLGGHAHTVDVEVEDRGTVRTLPIDGAFQHFSPAMYPRFAQFLEQLGVETFLSPVSCSLTWRGPSPRGRRDLDVDLTPSARTLWRALRPSTLRMLLSLRRAIEAGEEVRAWSMTVDEYLRSLPMPARFVDDVMMPFLAATLGTSAVEARRMSARAALRYPVAHQPESPLRPFLFREITGGSVSYVNAVAKALRRTTIRTGADVVALERLPAGGYTILERGGRRTDVDRVVLASPAWASAPLVRSLGLERLADLLGRVESIATKMSIHRAHELMPPRDRLWASWNIEVRNGESEGTIWSGRHTDGPYRGGLDVFKSWVTIRGGPRRGELRALDYRHPLMTPDYYAVQAGLREHEIASGPDAGSVDPAGPSAEGRGLYLAGSYREDIDSHESGLGSAIAVAERLAPGSARLQALADSVGRSSEQGSPTDSMEQAA
ncbi:MAG: FAD-dependent oxidoreductase [Acidobacteriota bacterium]